MAEVPVRELNQHTADVLARVEGGERVTVTRNGLPVALIEPLRRDPLAALIESGQVRPATRSWQDLSADQDPVDGSPGVAAVELDRRSDTRW